MNLSSVVISIGLPHMSPAALAIPMPENLTQNLRRRRILPRPAAVLADERAIKEGKGHEYRKQNGFGYRR